MDRRQTFSRPTQSTQIATMLVRSVLVALVLLGLAFSSGCNLQANRRNVSGRRAFEQGQYALAISEFQKALRASPNNADAYYNMGASFAALGKQSRNTQWLQQAEQYFRQAISSNDQHVDAHRGLAGLLMETKREQNAFELINQWRTRNPGSTAPLVELARMYQGYGDQRRATDLVADALKLNPRDLNALTMMGYLREVGGQTHLALDNYRRALQVDGNQQGILQKVAQLQYQLAARPVAPGTPTTQQPVRYGMIDPFLQQR